MRYRVLSIGKDRSGLFEPVVTEYADRLQRYAKTEFVIAGESRGEDASARRAEADLLKKKLGTRPEENRYVALHADGELLTSEAFAARIAAEARRDGRGLTFVIGGPSGFDPDFLAGAAWRLSLSRFTLPHQLARAVFAEQLYRAQTILRGEPYSK